MLLVLYVSRAWATTGARVFGSTVWGPNLGAYTGPQWPLTRGRMAAPLILSLPSSPPGVAFHPGGRLCCHNWRYRSPDRPPGATGAC